MLVIFSSFINFFSSFFSLISFLYISKLSSSTSKSYSKSLVSVISGRFPLYFPSPEEKSFSKFNLAGSFSFILLLLFMSDSLLELIILASLLSFPFTILLFISFSFLFSSFSPFYFYSFFSPFYFHNILLLFHYLPYFYFLILSL